MLFMWLLALCMLIALLGLVVAVIAALVRFVRKPGVQALTSRWVVLPLGCGVLPLVMIGSLLAIPWAAYSLRPSSFDFEEVFGTEPSASIHHLRGKTVPGFDSRRVFLAFDYSDATWQDVMRLTGNRESARQTDLIGSLIFNGDAPTWWKGGNLRGLPSHCLDPVYHSLYDINGWDDLILVNCRSDGRIYVLASNID